MKALNKYNILPKTVILIKDYRTVVNDIKKGTIFDCVYESPQQKYIYVKMVERKSESPKWHLSFRADGHSNWDYFEPLSKIRNDKLLKIKKINNESNL